MVQPVTSILLGVLHSSSAVAHHMEKSVVLFLHCDFLVGNKGSHQLNGKRYQFWDLL
jgi:hypothetical protein